MIGLSPIEQYRAEMKTIDLEPGEFEVIELGPPIDPEEYRQEQVEQFMKPFAEAAEALRKMGIAFAEFSETLRHYPMFNHRIPMAEPKFRERHHM
jgi:hypothetical protein